MTKEAPFAARIKGALTKLFSSSEQPPKHHISEQIVESKYVKPSVDLLSKAIVLNSDDEDVLNPELLELLLKTIFTSSQEIVDIMRDRLAPTHRSISAVEKQIETLVAQALERGEPNSTEMANDFNRHKLQTEHNRRAYSPTDRENPDAVFWPNPTDEKRPRSLFTELPYVQRNKFITKDTAIASIGSCFAVEIAYALQREGYNYLVKEQNVADDETYWFKDYKLRPYATSSAAWGIHFNCPSFLQLVEKAFGLRRPAKILWTNWSDGKVVYCDPFREEVEFPSIEAFDNNYEKHIQKVREVFTEAEVLVLTLGLNEVWYFKPDGSAFSRSPWRTAPSLVEHKILTVEENVNDLQRMLDILREHNPNIKLVVTLSPVPLHATFLADEKHIIEANTHSKSVLRVAAEEFVRRNEGVYYFPSFELVTICVEKPWQADQRHVSDAAVDQVMRMFKEIFCI